MRSEAALEAHARAEQEIRRALACGDARGAAAALATAYGGEIEGWLAAVHGPIDASDIYGAVMVQVVGKIRAFRGESSARTWVYQIARNEARQLLRRRRRQRGVLTPLEGHPSAEERPLSTRTNGRRADRVARLCEQLTREDRSLLVLRVDRGMSYREIAEIYLPDADAPRLDTEAARLRRRVHDITRTLRARLREDP